MGQTSAASALQVVRSMHVCACMILLLHPPHRATRLLLTILALRVTMQEQNRNLRMHRINTKQMSGSLESVSQPALSRRLAHNQTSMPGCSIDTP